MSGDPVWTSLWEGVVVSSIVTAIVFLLLLAWRRRKTSLAVSATTSVGFLLAGLGSILGLMAAVEPAFEEARHRGLYAHPSPLILWLPLVFAVSIARGVSLLRGRHVARIA